MRKFVALVVVMSLPLMASVVVRAAADIPAWAYAIAPPPPPPVPGAPPPVNAPTCVKLTCVFATPQIGTSGGSTHPGEAHLSHIAFSTD